MASALSIAFPPAPGFTERDLVNQSGKVFIVTGAASGVGFQLAQLLYAKNGTVYIAARSRSRATNAIAEIQAKIPLSKGRLMPLVVDLADMNTIKPAAQTFLHQESRLDVLVHNAGVMEPPKGSKTKSGHDLEMGTHCLGPYLLTCLLEDLLKKTAALEQSKPYSVRIVWVVSILQFGCPPGAMIFDEKDGSPKVLLKLENYMQSKAGEAWLGCHFAEKLDSNRILSVIVHPGLMRTELQRNFSVVNRAVMTVVCKPPVYGAYTELFAGWSSKVTGQNNGAYIMAWGRVVPFPDDIENGFKDIKAGGNGKAQKFLEWVQRETNLNEF